MLIYLVRHGETDWNLNDKIQGSSDVPLNKTGMEQAKALGERLKGVKFDRVYCSPLRRARETAEIALRTAGVADEVVENIVVDANLVERDYGEYEGCSGKEFDFAKYWDFELNCDEAGVEPIRAMFARGAKVKETLWRDNKPDDVVMIVAHGAALKAVYFNLVGYEVGKTNFRGFRLKNAEERVIEVKKDAV